MSFTKRTNAPFRLDVVGSFLRPEAIKEARTAAGAEIVQKETKNRSSNRALHMTEDIYRLLRRERARQAERRRAMGAAWADSGLVAVDGQGQPLSPNAVSLAFTRFIRRSGLPKITLHGLRHTFASVANSAHIPLPDISRALGHKDVVVTGRVYTHIFDQTHVEAVSAVARSIRGA